jgi:hypothetical protein
MYNKKVNDCPLGRGVFYAVGAKNPIREEAEHLEEGRGMSEEEKKRDVIPSGDVWQATQIKRFRGMLKELREAVEASSELRKELQEFLKDLQKN